jgi:hypothetical protein
MISSAATEKAEKPAADNNAAEGPDRAAMTAPVLKPLIAAFVRSVREWNKDNDIISLRHGARRP